MKTARRRMIGSGMPMGGLCRLTVSDDGVGLPPEAGLPKATGLGMKLINSLAGQLRGSVEVNRGAAWRLLPTHVSRLGDFAAMDAERGDHHLTRPGLWVRPAPTNAFAVDWSWSATKRRRS